MWFLFYPQLYTLFYVVIILCCILYYPLLCSCDDVYAECPVFPQKWGLNEKINKKCHSDLVSKTRLDSTRLDSTRLDSTSVLSKSPPWLCSTGAVVMHVWTIVDNIQWSIWVSIYSLRSNYYVHKSQPRWLSGLTRSCVHSLWLLVDHCVLSNWDRILVRAVKGLISRAGMVSICPLLWQRDVKLQQTNKLRAQI